MRSGVKPGKTTAKDFNKQLAPLQINAIDVGDLGRIIIEFSNSFRISQRASATRTLYHLAWLALIGEIWCCCGNWFGALRCASPPRFRIFAKCSINARKKIREP
jgi:hypothetical protein